MNDGSVKYVARVTDELPLSRMADYTSSLLIRRDLLLSIGMFNEQLSQNEDLECFLRAVACSFMAIVQDSLVLRRLHNHNVSVVNPQEASATYQIILDWLREYPERYAPGAARAYGEMSARRLISEGRILLERGQRREARALFNQSVARSCSKRGVVLWCVTFLRPATFNYLVALKRKFS